MTPMPPICAIAIARRDSVTVSIAAETNGMLSVIPRVRRVFVSTWDGRTSEAAGSSRTSSKVSPSVMGPSNMTGLYLIEPGRRA